MEKAGIVHSAEGVRGGYQLAPRDITVLDVVDAIEGDKPLFECREIRERCALFRGSAPSWATNGPCSIHATMLRAERAMRDALAEETLASLAAKVERKAPKRFAGDVREWLDEKATGRGANRPPVAPKGATR